MIEQTIVLFPLAAPQVDIYAVESAPSVTPKMAHKAQSMKPRPKSSGPVKATARLLIVRLALNHKRSICSELMLHEGYRSSSCTRARPRASKPERPSMRAFHLFRKRTLELFVVHSGEDTTASSIEPFSVVPSNPICLASEGMPIV